MRFYAYINQNIGRIRQEIKYGLIPSSILRHWEIYSRFDAYRKMGHTVVEAVMYSASDMNVTERTVFIIIKKMEQEL